MKSKDSSVWTTQEVEKYIQKMMSKSEITITELREKINVLTIKNAKLSKDLHDAKLKEKRNMKALTDATIKSRDGVRASNMQASISALKFKSFAEKWNNYFEEISKLNTNPEIVEAREEFKNDSKILFDEIIESAYYVLNGDDIESSKKKHIDLSNSEVYIIGDSKANPISKDDEKRFNNVLKEVKSRKIHTEKLNEESESGFSIEEALNPTDSLSDIVNDIMK